MYCGREEGTSSDSGADKAGSQDAHVPLGDPPESQQSHAVADPSSMTHGKTIQSCAYICGYIMHAFAE